MSRRQAEEKHTDQLFEARRAEINELESRSYLGLSEQERLRSLKLEHEFQRRVKEVDEKGDYDADDDDDMMERLFVSYCRCFGIFGCCAHLFLFNF